MTAQQPTDEEFCQRVSESLGFKPESCQPSTPLEDLATDSLSLIELSIDTQEEYEVLFGFDDLASIKTLGDLAALIRDRKSSRLTPVTGEQPLRSSL